MLQFPSLEEVIVPLALLFLIDKEQLILVHLVRV